MTLADLIGRKAVINGKVWDVYNDPRNPGMAYLHREVEIKGSKHPSGYRYGHSRRMCRSLPLDTPAEPAPTGVAP